MSCAAIQIRPSYRATAPLLEPEVIALAIQGDSSAFSRIVVAYRKRVMGVISRLINRPEDVEDVAQEVFVRLHRSLGQLHTPENFEAWLYKVTRNVTCDYLRRRKRSHEVRLSDLEEERAELVMFAAATTKASDDRHQGNVRECVDALLSRIPPKDRVLLLLKEVEGLSLEEMEGIYGVESNVLKVRLFRARQRTLKALQNLASPVSMMRVRGFTPQSVTQ
jgi:RNA polymerase sigma-70 factor (ECF subfamily)